MAQDTLIKSTIFSRIIISAKSGISKGVYAFLHLCMVMIPVYIAVALLKLTPILDLISNVFAPFMKYFGLPGASALAVVTGNFVNIYAALAIIAGIGLDARQITILAIMLGISHSQIMESAVIAKMKAKMYLVTTLRLVISLIVSFILNLTLPG